MSRRAVLIAVCACAFAAEVTAQISDAVPYAQRPVKEGDWEFSLTPYLWFPMTAGGDVGIANLAAGAGGGGAGGGGGKFLAGVGSGSAAGTPGGGGATPFAFTDDASFFDNLGIAPNARFEVRGSPWVFHFEGRYLNQDVDGTANGGAPASADFEAVYGEIAGGLEVYTWNTDGGKGMLDVYAGVRAWSMDVDVASGATAATIESEWLDLMVGTRATCAIDKDWSVSAGLAIGGFGLAESNDFTWEAFVSVGYAVAENVDLELGWRFLGFDREENGVDYDAFFHGPQIGATIRF
jgi:hypothetical protein